MCYIDIVNKKLGVQGDDVTESQDDNQNEPPKIKNKTFVEINRTSDTEDTTSANDNTLLKFFISFPPRIMLYITFHVPIINLLLT